jgi:hypothetical protein
MRKNEEGLILETKQVYIPKEYYDEKVIGRK